MSSRYWLLRSPKPGAFSAAIFRAPLSLFTTKVARASCSMSSAIIIIGYPPLIASSKTLIRSLAFVIFLSTRSSCIKGKKKPHMRQLAKPTDITVNLNGCRRVKKPKIQSKTKQVSLTGCTPCSFQIQLPFSHYQ